MSGGVRKMKNGFGEEEEEEEEWDADFLDQLIQVEEFALSSSAATQNPKNPNPNPIPFPSFQHHYPNAHSPPPQLSQNPTLHTLPQPPHNFKDQEIDRLKRELATASKQLFDLEQERNQLRNERNKKAEQIKFVYPHAAEKDTTTSSNLECGVPTFDNHGATMQFKHAKAADTETGYQINLATSSSKAIGVQTDKDGEFSNLDLNGNQPSQVNLSEMLLGIWGSASAQDMGRNLLSKLFMACPADFQLLFAHMSNDMTAKSGDSALAEDSSSAALQSLICSSNDYEAVKISQLYSVLTKISNGLLQLEALLEPLIDLCRLESVDILCSSLSILHVFLKQLLCSRRKLGERDSVKVEGAKSGNNIEDRGLFIVSDKDEPFASFRPFVKKELWCSDIGSPLSVNWVSLFELLHAIAVSKTQGHVRLKAISIMNVILLRTNAHSEREIFGQAAVFQSIAQFLKREAGSHVQKKALHLLYLLLNCPKLLSVFCSGHKEGDIAANDNNNASNCEGFSALLEGLVDCIACSGNNVKDIELRKRAVTMLAFLASSGKHGFEILVNYKLLGEKNFLILILQVLISEMNVEESVSSEPVECIKARSLLMREALILLNRVVSNPGYSSIVLQGLTASREMASLTIDIVSRLSQKDQKMRESEIVDLARLLKKRVFTYLGS
ncbi:protein SENSITIVE TO UV 2 isoform X2 [Mercurialis annua]|uniref:protein SENSITIVE TO UV 2 isoform X2 n=1 Tax=Mercurialis annua TaxID=3986 RepID=UPI00215EE70C|nr:protein SENSITIVE TO UV 2 isoform X2 [Mercurialis annua]